MKLQKLASLDRDALRHLHGSGSCPDLSAFTGPLDGLVLGKGVLQRTGAWRGKVFAQQPDGQLGGKNRLGLGPFEFKRFHFTARKAQSYFADREIVLLDHDHPGNPAWVRSFHDELVEVEPGLYLATSHQWQGGKLRFRAYFALCQQGQHELDLHSFKEVL